LTNVSLQCEFTIMNVLEAVKIMRNVFIYFIFISYFY